MLKSLFAVALLAVVRPVAGQTGCALPVVKVLRNNQEVPRSGAPLAPKVTLQVDPAPECPRSSSYRFTDAELTLVRGRRPLVPSIHANGPDVDLSAWMKLVQPGDRIYVFVPYKSLVVVAADGTPQPFPQPKLEADSQNGIGFNWALVP
ncbi:hypothetical protein [Hymenobacter sp. CRA2]|uniref:hypothetical protein n=1 Tax=Hymenobacter sp. CRA2 TaxID=1955620 RepID=UPI00098FE0CC|nr:hypothetical protein [Hymenobacter sp. CRA2]OON67125.1 hypothetical protein B0919_20070 [Hymenobacter sp. CRA2]